MDVARPEFVPDPELSREAMADRQRDIADAATFADDLAVDPATVGVSGDARQATFDALDRTSAGDDGDSDDGDWDGRETGAPLVAGVDQAFVGDSAVSVVIVLRDGEVVERVHAVERTEIPYVPGLLSFREGGAILSAFGELSSVPDLAIVDGSGRIHFREAGLATHVGVALDLPTVGVAKRLLCGTPRESLDGKLPAGARVAIEADADVTAPDGTVIGYAVQTRQFEGGDRYVNPVYVSPGHRVGADTAADLAERTAAGYKLPEPTRLADAYADEVKADVSE
jgi:deoxyribonuclease V